MDLLKGIAVVIDNGIGQEASIDSIIAKVREKGIPTTEFKDLATAERCMHNFLSINFIILDWKMFDLPGDTPEGVRAGPELMDDNKQRIINFIKKLREVCFGPVFIFTNEAQADIEGDILSKLRQAELYFDQVGRDFIHVRNKNEILQDENLFTEINGWVHSTPSIYVLKIWSKELLRVKNEVFWDLYDKSHGNWPKVLWEHFEAEKESPQIEINDTIFQLIMSKMTLSGAEKDKIIGTGREPNLAEIKDLFKRIMYQDGELNQGQLAGIEPGDIFKDANEYFLNIRPECDTVVGRSGGNLIYLLKGKKLTQAQLETLGEKYQSSGLPPKVNENFIWLLEGDGIVRFDFRDMDIRKFDQMKDKRLCRLLPPYITHIQQRFTSYLGRVGIPRLPKKIEEDILRPTPPADATTPTGAETPASTTG